MRNREYAELLLRKASEDEFTIEKLLPDPASPDEVIGFHAQQAVEKMLRAALTLYTVRYPYIHHLATLLDLLRENGISFPEELEEVRRLTPFATVFRYEHLPAEPRGPFNRSWALNCVRQARAWAESVLREKAEG